MFKGFGRFVLNIFSFLFLSANSFSSASLISRSACFLSRSSFNMLEAAGRKTSRPTTSSIFWSFIRQSLYSRVFFLVFGCMELFLLFSSSFGDLRIAFVAEFDLFEVSGNGLESGFFVRGVEALGASSNVMGSFVFFAFVAFHRTITLLAPSSARRMTYLVSRRKFWMAVWSVLISNLAIVISSLLVGFYKCGRGIGCSGFGFVVWGVF